MKRIVLDTNVIVSAFLNAHGVPSEIWRMVLNGQVRLCVDERILHEYYDVLRRPKFSFSITDVNDILAFIEDESDVVTAIPCQKIAADPCDQVFVDVALTARVEFLVTGNLKHFLGLDKLGVRAVSPQQFLREILEIR